MTIKLKLITIAAGGGLAAALTATVGGCVSLPSVLNAAAAAMAAVCSAGAMAGLLRYASAVNTLQSALKSADPFQEGAFRGTAAQELADAVSGRLTGLQEEFETSRQTCRDLTLQNQLLKRRRNSAESILNSIRDAVLVTDDKDRIILANESAEKLFGFHFDPAVPAPADDQVPCPELVFMIMRTRQSKTAHVRHELTVQNPNAASVFDVVLSAAPDEAGEVAHVVTVLHDMTREKEIAQMKNDFVSHVSHELKTPLASINAYAEMLVDGEAQDPETMQQFCGVIQGQAQRLSRLIEDILNISRIESGLVKVSKDTHSMALIIRDAVEMIQSYAQEKNIAVHAPEPILYDQVCIDRDMLSQVVINLLSNAVKYTPAGGKITVASELNELRGDITVTVTDTGVGIPAGDVDHVFDKFYRVQANNKYAKGTGLGLNLVKQIVETVHGGSVFVKSQQGEGSTFGFVLPLSRQPAAVQ